MNIGYAIILTWIVIIVVFCAVCIWADKQISRSLTEIEKNLDDIDKMLRELES